MSTVMSKNLSSKRPTYNLRNVNEPKGKDKGKKQPISSKTKFPEPIMATSNAAATVSTESREKTTGSDSNSTFDLSDVTDSGSERLLNSMAVMNTSLSGKLDNVLSELVSIKFDLAETKKSISELDRKVNFATDKVSAIEKDEIPLLKEKIRKQEEEIDTKLTLMEIHHRKLNLLVYGFPVKQNENIITTVHEILCHFLRITIDEAKMIPLVNAHRLPAPRVGNVKQLVGQPQPNPGPCPIIIRFSSMFDRDRLLRAFESQPRQIRGAEAASNAVQQRVGDPMYARVTIRSDLPPKLKKERGRLATEAYRLRRQEKVSTRIRLVGSKDTTGYEELRKHIRESTEFTKELALVLEERAEVEMAYSKLLTKLTVKANKVSKQKSGTLCAAWNILCGQFDAEASIHKTAAETIIKDIQKPLKKMAEQQTKSYKLFESPVDKAVKSMNDSRAELMKKRKSVYNKSKDSQTLVNQASNPNNAKGKPLSDKEVSKLKGKSQKSEDVVAKSEMEYTKQLIMAEKSRQDHEIALVEAASTVQKLEIERINQQKNLLSLYTQTIVNMTPKIKTCCDQINSALAAVQPNEDVIAIAKAKGKPPQPTYQLLMDAFQEDMNNGMSMNQRKTYVARQVKLIDEEIAKEERKKDDISRNQKNSTKATTGGQSDIGIQLMHSNDTINVLTASKYKLLASIAEMDGKPKPASGMAQFIRVNRDKQGSTVSTLHYPRTNAPDPKSTRNISAIPSLAIVTAAAVAPVAVAPVAAAPGPPGAVVAASAGVVAEKAPAPVPPAGAMAAPPPPPPPPGYQESETKKVLGLCTAIYDFDSTEDDQLEIREGDVINLLEKGDDGWWKGEKDGRIGLFPASYVKLDTDNEKDDDDDNDQV